MQKNITFTPAKNIRALCISTCFFEQGQYANSLGTDESQV